MRNVPPVGRPRTSKPRTPALAALGQAIEAVMKEHGLTHEQVADESGLHTEQVGSFSRGKGNPTYETLKRLCGGLPVTLAQLAALAEAYEMVTADDEPSARSAI